MGKVDMCFTETFVSPIVGPNPTIKVIPITANGWEARFFYQVSSGSCACLETSHPKHFLSLVLRVGDKKALFLIPVWKIFIESLQSQGPREIS